MAGATELFRLSARLVLDTDGFDSGIASAKKQVQGMGGAFAGAESSVTKLSSAMNVARGIAGAAGNALRKGFDIGRDLVETSASVKALDESMAVTFEGIEDRAAAAFKAVSEENNIAERRLQESGLAFFRQFSGAGMDSANAMMNMENALQLAADAAAAYDISLKDASSMIRSFVRGNVEAGESIGVFVNEQKRNELAMEEFGKKWQDLTEAERQFLLLDLVEQTYEQNKVLGQGAREADNYTNVVGNLESAWREAKATMGDAALPNVTEGLKDITDWVKTNGIAFTTIGDWFGNIATQAASAVVAIGDFTTELIQAAEAGGFAGVVDAVLGEGTVDTVKEFRDKSLEVVDDIMDPLASSVATVEALATGDIAVIKSRVKSMASSENWWDQVSYAAAQGTDDLVKAAKNFFGGFSSGMPSDETWMRRYVQEKTKTREAWIPQLPMDGKNLYIPWEPPQIEVDGDLSDDTPVTLQSELDSAPPLKKKVYGTWAGFVGDGGSGLADTTFFDDNFGGIGQWASGLERVPYDHFPAWLDRDETVLNRVEAEDWRATKRGENTGASPAAIGEAVKAALAGVSISMDGRTVGALVTPYVSREQAAEAWRRR